MSSESQKNRPAQPNDAPETTGATAPSGQNARMTRRRFIGAAGAVVGAAASGFTLPPLAGRADAAKLGLSRRLYVGVPGYGSDVTQGGVGVLVYDIDNGYRFVKRIPIFPEGAPVEPVTGIEASAQLTRLYVCTDTRMVCYDLLTDQMLWNNVLPGGGDRQSMTPDFIPPPGGGRQIWSPAFRLGYWNVLDPISGTTLAQVTVTNRGSHNTLVGPDGRRAYLASLNDPVLHVVDTETLTEVLRVDPFTAAIRPFTVNAAQTLCYTNVNNFLGFGIGDLKTGKVLGQIPVQGFPLGQAPRHGTRCHGIGITPDGTELWISDGPNHLMHIFDNTVFPPTQKGFVQLRSDPGWISFSIDGTLAYVSTGEVFDLRTKQLVAALFDEVGRVVQSEKLLEIDFYGNPSRPLIAGDQFGIG